MNRAEKMLNNTGRWLLDDPKSFTWMYAPSSSLLVVTGSASQGKSILARELAGNLFSLNESLLDTTKDSAPDYKKSPNTVLTSFDLMWKILEETAMDPDSGTIVCILDGLDKCDEDSATAPGLKSLLDKLGSYYGTENHKVHSVTHLKFLITCRPSEELDEIQNIRCEHCTSIQQVSCEDAANQISRDINEVIKTLIYNLSAAGILQKFKPNFAHLLQDNDVPTWQSPLRRKGITEAMVETHKDSIITWIAKATNADLSRVENQASPHISEEPEAMAEEVVQMPDPIDSGPTLHRAKGPTGLPRSNDQETPTEPIRPEPKRRQSTSIPFRHRPPVYTDEEELDIKAARASDAWFARYEETLGRLSNFDTFAKEGGGRLTRIKIAILSTGVDLKDPFIRSQRTRIRRIKCFVDQLTETKGELGDHVGIGTHSVGLLLQLAPETDLYVSNAIEYATSEIPADIILMGFGLPRASQDVQRAIRFVSSKDIIMISGAGNRGANEAVFYPAKDP
ncbi:uncharacterized protein PAC_04014 [Phialocephala subalpina]|uniref:Nephrocystin 3-like N-terminal domain-containing protein n=1 Tax=Phialocephala subalpina TaxID=576137 RepID=A0A1L7WMX9_9HELO|nr:uncharacterized protein PAC_04014 [Phialocephala subalpina]